MHDEAVPMTKDGVRIIWVRDKIEWSGRSATDGLIVEWADVYVLVWEDGKALLYSLHVHTESKGLDLSLHQDPSNITLAQVETTT